MQAAMDMHEAELKAMKEAKQKYKHG